MRWSAIGAAGSSRSPSPACMSFPDYRARSLLTTVMRDQLRERHGAAEGAAWLAAAAIMGETVPPSIAMLIVGSITSVSVGAMFIGGLLPAALMALCLMVLVYAPARPGRTPAAPPAPSS